MIVRMLAQSGALLLKEVQHHALAVLGVVVLYGAMGLVLLNFQLNLQAGSIIEVAANLGWIVAPMVCAFLVRRLIVLEYKQQTHEFLTGLPGSALGRAAVKGLLGLVVVELIVGASTGVVAGLAALQEITPLAFVVQVIAQIGVYVWAWFAITFIAAHLGRFRAVFWLLFLPGLISVSTIDHRLIEEVLFTASLARPLDQARVYVPWTEIGVTTAWALGLSILGLALAALRDGAVVSGWFRPASARERAAMAVAVILGLFALSYAEELPWLGGPVYQQVPAVRPQGDVRVLGTMDPRLQARGERVQATLDRLRPHLAGELPDLILVAAHGDPDTIVKLRSSDFREIVLVVDTGASLARVEARVLGTMLDWWNGTQLRRRGGLAWIVLGTPRWYSALEDGDAGARMRAAWAGAHLQGPDDLRDLRDLEARYGTDVARGLAFVGLEILEEQGGESAVHALVETWLRHEGRDDLQHAVRMDLRSADAWFTAATGLDAQAHRAAWYARVQALYAEHRSLLDRLPTEGSLEVGEGEESDVVIDSRMPARPPGLTVAWTVLPPLHARPLPGADWDRRPVREAEQRIPTSAPGHRDIVARYEAFFPIFDGDVAFGTVAP